MGGIAVAAIDGQTLSETIYRLRGNIKKISQKQTNLNEEMTKVALINPLLSALGWELEDPDEVSMEYRKKPRDRPVDYALFIQRSPYLFVEAKPLRADIEDRKWTSQTISYAAVTGVEWCVLTNGDEYRIYNAHAPVDVEEKLFRTVRVSDEDTHSYTVETLELLSKDKVGENRLSLLWKAYHIDYRVKRCLDNLFQNQSESLVRLIKKYTSGLTTGDVRKSLERVEVKIDFPVAPPQLPITLKPPTKKPKATSKVTLKDLLAAGLITAPVRIEREYQGHKFEATIQEDGTIEFQGERYTSPSIAGGMAKSVVRGPRPGGKAPYHACNGWLFWRYYDRETGGLEPTDKLRQLYIERQLEKGPEKEREGGLVYCLTPVKSTKEQSNVDCVRSLVMENGIYAFSEATPQKNLKPGDLICFYASGIGVIAHARVKTRPKREPNPSVRNADKYPFTFEVEDVKFYPENPVVIDSGLRQRLDTFKGLDAAKHWGWFVTPTRRITEHDFKILTRGEV